MSAVVSVPPPPPWASPITRSATWIVGGTANCVLGRDQLLLQRARDRERLEGRARLVVELDGAVLARVLRRALHVVGVHPRPVGQRQDGARARVHDERGGPGRRVGLTHLAQHCLDALLDGGIERQAQVVARFGAVGLDQAHGLPERVLDHAPVAVVAAELLFAVVFEPGQPLVLGAHRTQHLRGEMALGIGALRLYDGVDALDVHLLDPVAEGRVHLATQVDEAGISVAQLLDQLVLGAPDQGGEPGRHVARVVDQERMREHRHRVLRDRQLNAVAIEDRASPGGDLEVLDLLLQRALPERAGLDGPDPDGA